MKSMAPREQVGLAVPAIERHPRHGFRRMSFPLTVCAMCLILGGCQLLPGDGPKMSRASPESLAPLPYDVIDLDPTSVLPYRTTARVDGSTVDRSTIVRPASAGRKVSVGPGDVLKVRILEAYDGGIFPTAQKAGADLGSQHVTDAGAISVPFVGDVNVRGLDLGQIEQRILERLKGKAQEPQVIVELLSDRSNTVMVSGDVKIPGRFSVLDGTRSVADAINRAWAEGAAGDRRSPAWQSWRCSMRPVSRLARTAAASCRPAATRKRRADRTILRSALRPRL